jgi:hypothetical protein
MAFFSYPKGKKSSLAKGLFCRFIFPADEMGEEDFSVPF